jgi:hypothetical protein
MKEAPSENLVSLDALYCISKHGTLSPYWSAGVLIRITQELYAHRIRAIEDSFVPVNSPFKRVPKHADDPGFGPVPPEPDHCPHGVRKEFRSNCVLCNTPDEVPVT